MNSPIPWMGGKRRLADSIFKRMPDHSCYVEPFAGGASILFMREEPAKVEVLNDINGELVNFYRVVKHHLIEFCNQFRWAIVSRKMFEWLKDTPVEILTDIQRAARFYYLQKSCFGARPTNQTFGTATTAKPKLNLVNLEQDMSDTHARLARVLIESLSWMDCLKKYDRKHSFFFMDPPYWKLAGYGLEFGLDQYQGLADSMAKMKGKSLLTINDHKDIRKIFKGFKFDRVELQYTVGGNKKNTKKSGELIYRNW